MMNATTLLQNLFAPARRLYALEGEGTIRELAVEAWLGREALSELSEWRVVAVSANARIVLDAFIGQRVTLVTTLAGGTQARRTGLVRQAEQLGADGSLARYRLTVVPWFWLATQQRHSQVFQNRPLADIFEQVLSPYEPYASWRFAAGAEDRMAAFGTRRRLTQFRETDYHFVTRLLAEAGLGFTTVEDEQAPSGHTLLIFADSRRLAEDAESAAGGGIRYHRAHSQEERDAIQQLICHSRVSIDGVAVSAWDAEAKRSVRGHAPARFGGGMGCPDPYLSISPSLAPDRANAQRIAEQAMESVEARSRLFIGRGTVRTLRSGTRLKVVDCPHLPQDVDGPYPLLMDLVEHCGINSLTADTQAALGQKLGGLEAALTFDTPPSPPESGPGPFGFTKQDEPTERLTPTGELLAAARAHGYAGQFRACDARRPWRVAVSHTSTSRLYSAPTVKGVHSAIVVGPDGQTEAGGDGEHHTNPRGQIRVRLPWQQGERADDRSTGWVPVAQRQAGAGMGWQWLPRIGQEVLLKCLEDDIDQMVVIGALYNGRGEGGLAPTPGGRAAKGQIQRDPELLYHLGDDSAPSAQANLAAGQSPAWHGMGTDPEGHRNAAALSGFKSAEHGGRGYSQLVFDDSDGQLRTQLATTQAYSQLNLGHLIHQQDNRRGSFRGQGFELRTDGYGAVRGQAGLLVTTYRDAVSGQAVPTGDNVAGIALIKQAKQLTSSLSQGAVTHQTAALSTAKDDRATGQARKGSAGHGRRQGARHGQAGRRLRQHHDARQGAAPGRGDGATGRPRGSGGGGRPGPAVRQRREPRAGERPGHQRGGGQAGACARRAGHRRGGRAFPGGRRQHRAAVDRGAGRHRRAGAARCAESALRAGADAGVGQSERGLRGGQADPAGDGGGGVDHAGEREHYGRVSGADYLQDRAAHVRGAGEPIVSVAPVPAERLPGMHAQSGRAACSLFDFAVSWHRDVSCRPHRCGCSRIADR